MDTFLIVVNNGGLVMRSALKKLIRLGVLLILVVVLLFRVAGLAGVSEAIDNGGWLSHFFGISIWIVGVAIVYGIEVTRGRLNASRSNHTECVICKYNLTGNLSGRCPECGQIIAKSGNQR